MRESKEQFFKIGEMADLFDLNIRTLRYYDQIDLVKPEFTDPATGYRYYSTAQFEPLNTIRYLRDLGMSLEDIRAFLGNRDVEGMKAMMHTQLAEVEQRQRDLDLIRRKLQTRLEQIHKAQEGPLGRMDLRMIGVRRAVLLRYTLSPDTDLEYPIRLLAKTIGVRGVFLGMVGLSIRMQKLDRGQFDNYDNIFLLLDGEIADSSRTGAAGESGNIGNREALAEGSAAERTVSEVTDPNTAPEKTGAERPTAAAPETMFPAGTYAVLRFRGTHAAAAVHYQILHREILRQGYEICGDSLEITLVDFGLTSDPEHFVTELQIPVQRR